MTDLSFHGQLPTRHASRVIGWCGHRGQCSESVVNGSGPWNREGKRVRGVLPRTALGSGSMVKLVEQALNAVNSNKPNRTDRLGPNRRRTRFRDFVCTDVDTLGVGGELGPKLPKEFIPVNRETPSSSQKGKRAARHVNGRRAEDGTRSERPTVMVGIGDERIAPWRKPADVSRGDHWLTTCRTSHSGGGANGCGA